MLHSVSVEDTGVAVATTEIPSTNPVNITSLSIWLIADASDAERQSFSPLAERS
jgi:hypothetical protein